MKGEFALSILTVIIVIHNTTPPIHFQEHFSVAAQHTFMIKTLTMTIIRFCTKHLLQHWILALSVWLICVAVFAVVMELFRRAWAIPDFFGSLQTPILGSKRLRYINLCTQIFGWYLSKLVRKRHYGGFQDILPFNDTLYCQKWN